MGYIGDVTLLYSRELILRNKYNSQERIRLDLITNPALYNWGKLWINNNHLIVDKIFILIF